MDQEAGPSPEKNLFGSKVISLGAVWNRQKTGIVTRSLGTRILRLNREKKLTKAGHKLHKISRSDQSGVGGRRAVAPSPRHGH